MAFDFSTVKNKKSSGFDFSSVKGKTERTDEEKREYVKSRQKSVDSTSWVSTYENYNNIVNAKDYAAVSKQGRADYDSFYNERMGNWFGKLIKDSYAAKLVAPMWDRYSEEEKDIYGYLYATDKDEANKFMIAANKQYEKTDRKKEQQELSEWAEENPVLGSAASLLVNVGAPVDYIRNVGGGMATEQMFGEGYILPTTGFSGAANALQSGVQKRIEENTGFEILGANVAAQLYGIGMSTANSAALVTAMGPLAVAEMAMQAASSATMESLDRGVSDIQAIKYGTAAGVAEALFEYVSFDNLVKIKNPHTLKQAIKSIAAQSGIEASEEVFTSLANTLSDLFINGNKSEYMANYANYVSEGKSKSEATARALADWGGGLLWDALAGFVSGGVMGGGANVYQSLSAKNAEKTSAEKTAKNIGENKQPIIDYAMEAEEGSEVRKAAENIKARAEKGETISDKEYADILMKADDSFAAAEIKKQIAYEAKQSGETINDEQLEQMSTSVLKTVRGDFISESENAQIEQSKAAKNVYARNTGKDYTYGEKIEKKETQKLEKTEQQRVVEEIIGEHSEGFKKLATESYAAYAESGAQNLLDQETFVDEFTSFYDLGRSGVESIEAVFESYPAVAENPVLKNSLEQAYVLGRGEAVAEAMRKAETKQSAIDTKLQNAKGKAVSSVGSVRLATEEELARPGVAAVEGKVVAKGKKLSGQQRASMQFAREFAKLSGINIVFYEGGKSKGWYDSKNNEIFLNVEEGMNLKTLSHELTHFIQQYSPKQYEEFKQFLLDYYRGTNKLEKLLYNQEKLQGDLSQEELEDEIVANACQMFISDTEAMQKLIDTQSKGLIETITRWFKNMCDYLRKAFEGVRASHSAAKALEEDIEMLEKARDKWYELLNESITVSKQIDTNAKNQARNYDESKRQFEIKEYSAEEKAKHVAGAKKYFGTTYNWNEAGYLLPDGSRLDFSGKKFGGSGGYRSIDHREIDDAFDYEYGTESRTETMIQFMQEGNIRIMPESGGINIAVEPTKNQYDSLGDFISRNRGEVVLDFDDAKGNTIASAEYNRGTYYKRVIDDIKAYFENGTIPKGSESEVGKYRFEMKDSDGNILTKEQQEYFKDSKVRDENDNLAVVYHGTRKADFTVFNMTANYYTDNEDVADSYAPDGEKFKGYLNIVNPFIIDAEGERWSRIPIDSEMKKLLEKYGSSSFKEDGRWRSSSDDIVYAILDGIDEGEFDYDGIIIKNVDDTGGYWKKSNSNIASDYVTFNSNQFKNLDNKAPTKDPDIRFELKSIDSNKSKWNNKKRKKSTVYDEFASIAMSWANEIGRKAGDTKKLYSIKTGNIVKIEADGYGDYSIIYVYTEKEYEELYGHSRKTGTDGNDGNYRSSKGRSVRDSMHIKNEEEHRNVLRQTDSFEQRRSNSSRSQDDSSGDYGFELKDEDENRLEILETQEERLVNDLKTLEKYYGDAIRQVYEQNIKPNEGISKRAEELNRKAARRFMNEVGAMFHVPNDTREEYLLPIINEIIDKGPAISENEGIIERLYQTAYKHTEDYIVDTDPEGNYKNLRDYIRKTSIFINAGTKADVGDYNNFRKRNMGSLRLSNDQTALGLDEFYEEIANLAPEIFSGTTDGAEQLYELSSFMKDRGRTESIGDFMPQEEYTAWADEMLEPELNQLFDSTIGSFLSEATRKEGERKRAVKVDRAMENVTGAIQNYEAAQDYARAEGFLAGQIEQGKKMSAEMRRKQEDFERKAKNYEDMIAKKRAEIKKVRERRDEILEERRQAYQAYREKRSEQIKGGAFRKRIERNAKTLGDWLLKNSDKEHIPEALKTTVGGFLASIDFTSKRALAGGKETQKDIRFGVRLNDLAAVLRRQQDYMNGANENKGNDSPIDAYLDLPAGFAEEVSDLAKDVLKASENRGFTVNDMNSEQLAQLDEMLRVLKTSISKMNKLLANAHFASATAAAESTMAELKNYKEHKLHGKNVEDAIGLLDWKTFTPVYAFKRYGKAGESVFEGIQKGWGEFAFAIKKVLDFADQTYTDKEVNDWGEEVHTLTLASGNEMKITSAQLMSLYCLLKREQARGHIFGGGIRIADIDEGKSKIQQAEAYLFTYDDVQTIYDELTQRQKDVADKMQKFMTEQGSAWGNKVSMERFGYRAFTEDNYFPIESDPNNLIAVDPEAKANDMFRLLNMSATKSLTKNANNAIVISNIFDVFSNHMSDMAKYGTLALPILDTMKWYNYKIKFDRGNGQFATETVQKSVERAYGRVGKSYFTTFMKDLNGVKEGGRGLATLNKLTSNYKIAAVGANLRTAVLQPTSIVRALNVIDAEYLVKAAAMKPSPKEAEKYSGIALWKSMGFYNTDVSRGIREQIKGGKTIDKIRDKSMWAAEQADRITWGVLWNAAKLKAQEQGYKGEEINNKTAEIFDEIIYKTQVVDSTLTRNELMRSNNPATSSITAFMAEPTISYNMMADSVFSIRMEKDFSTGWKKHGDAFRRAIEVYMLSTFVSAAVQSIADAMRDDDEEENAIEKFWQAFYGERFFDGNLFAEFNPLEKIPLVRDFLSVFKGYGNERMETSAVSSLKKALDIIIETYRVEVLGEKPTSTTYYGKMTGYGKVYATAKAVSQLTGLPFSNAMREGATIWNLIVGNMAPSLKLKTYDDSKKE